MLYEKYRPRRLEDVVGQPKAVREVRSAIRDGAGGKALWISGASGTGKTTIARIVADTIADKSMTVEYDAGDQFTQAEFDDCSRMMEFHGWGKGGRAWIINEAHGIRAPIVRQLCGLCERLPAHCLMVFTTTREGQEALFDDHADAGMLLSRCVEIRLTNQGLSKPFADVLLTIARAEGLDGLPVEHYVKAVQSRKNNLRASIQDLARGQLIGGGA